MRVDLHCRGLANNTTALASTLKLIAITDPTEDFVALDPGARRRIDAANAVALVPRIGAALGVS